MNIYTFLVLVILAVGGFLVFSEKKESASQTSAKEPSASLSVANQAPEPPPVGASSVPPVGPGEAPGTAPMPVEEVPAPPAPTTWYTARRVSMMTDTGVSSVPAGVEVTKLSDSEILYEGKRFAVKPGDLTDDVVVVAEILDKQEVAEARVQAQRQAATVVQQENSAALEALGEEQKAAQLRQIDAAIASIDRQIKALQEKISAERHEVVMAELKGRSSARGVTITKCEQAITKLEAERLRLTQMK